MKDFIYDVLAPTINLFAYPFYPATILLFVYISYALIKNRTVSKWKILGLSLLSLLPTFLLILDFVLEIVYAPDGLKYAYVIFMASIGIVINLISSILLIIYFFKYRVKTQVEPLARAQ